VGINNFCGRDGVTAVSSVDESSLKPGENFMDITHPFARFPMVGNFITTVFPVWHITSTTPNDEEFATRLCNLEKWLKIS